MQGLTFVNQKQIGRLKSTLQSDKECVPRVTNIGTTSNINKKGKSCIVGCSMCFHRK